MIVGIDFETASAADLKTVGAWAYSLHPSTRVWCAVYGTTGGLKSWRIGDLPPSFPAGCTMLAHNCAFEKSIWQNVLTPRYGWPAMPERWEDTQAHAAAANLPVTLEGLGAALGCPIQKDTEGGDLMKKMCWLDPDGAGGWTNEHDTPENQQRLLQYCETDVRSMFAIWQRVPKMIPAEQRLWQLDQKINARGMFLDRPFVKRMQEMVRIRTYQLEEQCRDITGFDLAASTKTPALKAYLKDRGVVLPKVARVRSTGEVHASESIGKQQVIGLAAAEDTDPEVKEVLQNRLEASKASSLAKLSKVELLVDPRDGRLRNALQFCAAHPGRWSSRGLQIHNLPKDRRDKAEAAMANALVYAGDLGGLIQQTKRPLEAMSLALRSMIAAPPGKELIAADFKAAQAIILAWLAGQEDVLDIFRDPTRDIYIEDAAKIGSTNRDLGKLQRLGLGFQMGAVKAHSEAPKYKVKLTTKEARAVVEGFRKNNAAIVALWASLENAVIEAVARPGLVIPVGRFLKVAATNTCLMIQLPSGRAIRYWQPRVSTATKTIEFIHEDGTIKKATKTGPQIQFFTPAKDAVTMELEDTFGGKLAENVTMGVERDLLGHALTLLDDRYPVVIHVHDSIASEVPAGFGRVEEFCKIMSTVPSWAPGLPLAASGYRDTRFRG